MTYMTTEVKQIPRESLKPATNLLRPVRETGLAFAELVHSIRCHGLLKSILVTQDGVIIDGMRRYRACAQAGISSIPCIVKEVKGYEEYLAIQLQANALTHETEPIEYAEQMRKLMDIREQAGTPISLRGMGRMVGKSQTWVADRLRLLYLAPEVRKALRRGIISLSQANILSRLNGGLQYLGLEMAADLTVRELEIAVGQIVNQIKGERAAQPRPVVPTIRPMKKLLAESESLDELLPHLLGVTTVTEAARVTLRWVLGIDRAVPDEWTVTITPPPSEGVGES